ncbi:MAG: hypothetical protein NTX79_07665, partial [Candidatus Micrarchaeota archaeon]|nr:hypothetical protein [Candidatus Micrarchaeota archaeon]
NQSNGLEGIGIHSLWSNIAGEPYALIGHVRFDEEGRRATSCLYSTRTKTVAGESNSLSASSPVCDVWIAYHIDIFINTFTIIKYGIFMSVSRQKKSSHGISGNAEPFSEQKGTAIIQAQTAKIEKLLALRNEVYAIDPKAISKKDISKIAEYALGLCGLTMDERKAVVFANEAIVNKRPANQISSPEDSKDVDEETALQNIHYRKWEVVDEGKGNGYNSFCGYHWYSPSPKVKLLAMIYIFETNFYREIAIDCNVIGSEEYYKLGNVVGSPESATRLFFSALALEIINSKDLKKENLREKDFDCMFALNHCERRINPERYQLGYDAAANLSTPYFQEMYSRLDSIKEQAQKILES